MTKVAGNRQERIARAEQIVSGNPLVSKRALQTRIKAEFGVGLSDTARRHVLQKANTPAVLRKRIGTPAFKPTERVQLRRILHRTGSTPYLARAINERFTAAKAARDAGLTRRDFRRQVTDDAKASGYIATHTTRTKKRLDGSVKGQVDWWKLLRDYRKKDIEGGDYTPKIRPRPRTDRGQLKAQKDRKQAQETVKARNRRLERESTQFKGWITQKDKSIAASTGARRRQLEQERANLQRELTKRQHILRNS